MRGFEYQTVQFNKGFIKTIDKDTSYSYGASLASNFILQGIEVDPIIFLNAFHKTTSDDSTILNKTIMQDIIKRYDQQLREQANERAKIEAEKNKVEGEDFIKKYLTDFPDAVETESGLVYRELVEGFGEKPKEEDRVVVQYTGKLLDGTIFDSSFNRGEPTTFRIGAVIQGWQEGLQLMNVGSKWELVIPSEIAYGNRSTGNIPANSTLIFEVELLGIE
jgi:FKBP-type peptidyl-prolyl cis-trans isomerase